MPPASPSPTRRWAPTCFATTCARWPRRAWTPVCDWAGIAWGVGHAYSQAGHTTECWKGGLRHLQLPLISRHAYPCTLHATTYPTPPFHPAAEVPAPVDVAAVQAELRAEKPDVVAAVEAARQAPGGEDAPACVSAARREEFEVTFLGTGAAIPSKYRNVTGIHVNLFDRGGLLMDCGEAAAGAGLGAGLGASGGV